MKRAVFVLKEYVRLHFFLLASFFLVMSATPFSASQWAQDTPPEAERERPFDESRTMTWEDRVACQRAIEEVYWRHRLWPQENPQPKPALEDVMPLAVIQAKVADAVRKSEALRVYWQRPITGEQLQAEMERMARQTKRPEMLAELWAALGNAPYRIAECLARPALANRLLGSSYARDEEYGAQEWKTKRFDARWNAAQAVEPGYAYRLPAVGTRHSSLDTCDDDTWATMLIPVVSARALHTAVWTGSEMIVWGGRPFTDTGGRYDPATDSWVATSTIHAPSPRDGHTAIWTGSEMIVWGGSPVTSTGGRYNPAADTWVATSTTNVPSPRYSHTAVWTGGEMIVWGGFPSTSTGGRYDPANDSWTATNTTGAPSPRDGHTAVWTGGEMIVWGGFPPTSTGGRYAPATDSWILMSTTNAPSPRYNHTAVWTDTEMIVWGGQAVTDTGGRYDPASDSWVATSTSDAPSPRRKHTAVWTGGEMIVWGGWNLGAFQTGGRYDPASDTWVATSTAAAPGPRGAHTAVWTDHEMIVWGGENETYIDNGGRYCAAPRQARDRDPTAIPASP